MDRKLSKRFMVVLSVAVPAYLVLTGAMMVDKNDAER
jgi:hypothetical protein